VTAGRLLPACGAREGLFGQVSYRFSLFFSQAANSRTTATLVPASRRVGVIACRAAAGGRGRNGPSRSGT